MEITQLLEGHQTMLVMYLMAGTILIVLVIILLFFAQSRRMNWYEKNVLDLSRTNTQRVRCKAFNRLDTEDDRDSIHEVLSRKQSRIVPMRQGKSSQTPKITHIRHENARNYSKHNADPSS
ncbi:unnamed protein product, partial [Mesorhabditis spiculigera]